MRASAALPVAVVVVLLVLAGGAWYLTRGDADRAPASLDAAPARAASVPRAPSAALEGAEGLPDGPERAPERAALVESAPSAAPEVAVALLGGRVVDGQGRGVSGAEVRLERRADLAPFRGPGTAPRAVRAVRAGADGAFELEVGEGGARRLRVDAPGFAPFERGVDLVAGVARDLGSLRLDRGVVLAGRVVDPSGRPAPGVELHRPPDLTSGLVPLFASPGALAATTDAEGRFVVDRQAVGPWSLIAVSSDHPHALAEGRTERPGERVDGIEIALEEGATIAGRVVGRPTGLGEALRVRADPPSTRQSTSYASAEPALVDRRVAEVGAEGGFRLRGLRRGQRYDLVLLASDEGPGADLPFLGGRVRGRLGDVPSGESGVELAYEPGAALVFQVVDGQSGVALADFEVEAGTAWPLPLTDDEGRPLRRHPEGRVRYEGLRPSAVHPTATVRVRAVGYEDFERSGIALDPLGPEGEVDLGVVRLTPMPVVRVHVRDRASGEPVAGAHVVLSAATDRSEGMRFEMRQRVTSDEDSDDVDGPVLASEAERSGVTDAAGLCTLNGLPGRSGEVRVTASGYAPFESDPLALPAHAFDYDVELSPGGGVEVRVVDAAGDVIAGAFVEHRDPSAAGGEGTFVIGDDDRQGGRTGADGLVRFDHLLPGSHAFRVGEKRADPAGFQIRIEGFVGPDGGADWSEVFVPEGERVGLTLVAPPRARLAGVVTQGGEPLPGARVRLLPADEVEGFMPPWMASHPSTRTDSAGRYELEDLRVDEHRLEIAHDSRAMPAEVPLTLSEGDNRRDVELPLSVVEGRVTDPDGEPVAGARVHAERTGGGQNAVRVMVAFTTDGDDAHTSVSTGDEAPEAETDADGRYVLRGVLCDTDLVVEARGGAFEPTRSEPFQVAPDAVRTGIDVVLRAAGSLEVTVLDAAGAPVVQALVQARFTGDSDNPVEPQVGVTKADGRATLSGLRAGAWSVSADRIGGGESSVGEGERHPVAVASGETAELTIRMP